MPAESTNWNEIFVGRKSYIEALLNTQESTFIFGARRIGKTTLLQQMETRFGEHKVPAFYFSIEGEFSSTRLIRRVENAFLRNKFNMPQVNFQNPSFFDFLEELDLQLQQKIVFLIDEVEQIIEIDKNEQGFISKLRNCVETLTKIRFVLTASPHFKKIIPPASHSSAFLSAFTIKNLTVMDREEITKLIQKRVPQVSQPVIDRVLEFTHYQPYLVRIFVENLLHKEKFEAITEKLAIETYVDHALDGIFPNYFAGLIEEDQEVIRQIHRNQFQVKEQHQTKLMELSKYGYLKMEAGEYKISNWFFDYWLIKESSQGNQAINKPKIQEQVKPKAPSHSVRAKAIGQVEVGKNEAMLHLIYSLGGLFLGALCILGGVFLLYNEVAGSSSWTASVLGMESDISDAPPGVTLFIVGVFMVFITRLKIKK